MSGRPVREISPFNMVLLPACISMSLPIRAFYRASDLTFQKYPFFPILQRGRKKGDIITINFRILKVSGHFYFVNEIIHVAEIFIRHCKGILNDAIICFDLQVVKGHLAGSKLNIGQHFFHFEATSFFGL